MTMARKPMAFSPDEVELAVAEPDMFDAPAELARELDALAPVPAGAAVPIVPKKRRWLGVLAAAVGGLVSLAVGLAIDNLIRDLIALLVGRAAVASRG